MSNSRRNSSSTTTSKSCHGSRRRLSIVSPFEPPETQVEKELQKLREYEDYLEKNKHNEHQKKKKERRSRSKSRGRRIRDSTSDTAGRSQSRGKPQSQSLQQTTSKSKKSSHQRSKSKSNHQRKSRSKSRGEEAAWNVLLLLQPVERNEVAAWTASVTTLNKTVPSRLLRLPLPWTISFGPVAEVRSVEGALVWSKVLRYHNLPVLQLQCVADDPV